MERCGRYCQGEKAVRDNTKVFVLSNWLENSSHILLLGTLEEEQIGRINKNSALDRLSLRCLLDIQINSFFFFVVEIYISELSVYAAAKSFQSCPTLCNPIDWTVQPTRLRHPWDSPGKNTGVGCHLLLQCINSI